MPAARLLRLLAFLTLPVVAGFLSPALFGVALIGDALAVVAALIDWRRAVRSELVASRQWPPMLVQGARADVTVELRQTGPEPLVVSIRESLSPALAEMPLRHQVEIPAGGSVRWTYRLTPRMRGTPSSGPLVARILGPWGLAWSQRTLLAGDTVRVYPQVRWEGRVGQLLVLAQRRRMGQLALRVQGAGTEPYALREYLVGDPPHKIHWKSTARHGRLITREEAWERGSRLILLLDCARSMAAPAGERSKLDAALAAVLALSRVAAARGDQVTIIAFSDRIDRLVRVRAGGRGINRAYAALFDLEARLTEPAYDLAVEAAATVEARRGVAVLFTSVVDLVAADLLRTSLLRLGNGRRSLLVNLEDPELLRLLESEPSDAPTAFAQVAALEIALANRRLARHLRRGGVRVVTSSADRLALSTLEAYLALHRGRGPSGALRAS
jgi:uncharacterized protein (DUF58 family)